MRWQWVGWALVAAGCREQNPYFVEPPLATSSGGASEGGTYASTTAPTTGGLPVTTSTDSTGATSGMSATDTGTTYTSMTSGTLCEAGVIVCEADMAKVCDGVGGFESTELCSSVCAPGLGCVLCTPDATRCAGQVVQSCTADGSAWQDVETCDALQGLTCDAMDATCVGLCAEAGLGLRQSGCDFYGSSLANLHTPDPWTASYGVLVVNTGVAEVTITVTRGDQMVTKTTVASFGSTSISLSYIDEVSQSGPTEGTKSLLVADGAYRLRSTQPVVIYQFEPLQPSSTGDASLLLPVHTWGTDYLIASREFWVGNAQEPLGGFYAVLASEDATQVTLTPPDFGGSVGPGGGVAGDGSGVVTLDAGDVLEVFAIGGDITGTRVTADRPVAVFGGHRCSQVPLGQFACDHLEESMPPIGALSKEYIVTPPLGPDLVDRPQMIRVIATEAETQLTFSPPQEAPTSLDYAGQWAEVGPTTNSFSIVADKKILVAQYLTGGLMATDPSMTIAVPTGQYRASYILAASPLYVSRLLTVIAPSGASLTMDGSPIEGLTQIDGTNFVTRSLSMSANVLGTHLIAGDQPFGASVYGHALATSYWYPGGLELQTLP